MSEQPVTPPRELRVIDFYHVSMWVVRITYRNRLPCGLPLFHRNLEARKLKEHPNIPRVAHLTTIDQRTKSRFPSLWSWQLRSGWARCEVQVETDVTLLSWSLSTGAIRCSPLLADLWIRQHHDFIAIEAHLRVEDQPRYALVARTKKAPRKRDVWRSFPVFVPNVMVTFALNTMNVTMPHLEKRRYEWWCGSAFKHTSLTPKTTLYRKTLHGDRCGGASEEVWRNSMDWTVWRCRGFII